MTHSHQIGTQPQLGTQPLQPHNVHKQQLESSLLALLVLLNTITA